MPAANLDIPPGHDPLGVLRSTRFVVHAARHVRIDHDRVASVAADIARSGEPPSWDVAAHWHDPDDPGRTAAWVFVLDALNFCFWAQDGEPDNRWRVRYDGASFDGYWALTAALRRAMAEHIPLTDPDFLATISEHDVAQVLRPDVERPHTPEVPLMPLRVAHLRELGQVWQRWGEARSDRHPALAMIAAANRSASELVRIVVRELPSFDDVARYDSEPVRMYKRAQILAGDLAGTFDHAGPGAFDDLDGLTAFADYKVPQVLRQLGVLVYDDELAARIGAYERIPAGSPAEVEIRAATIWGCELLRQAIARQGRTMRALELDWSLWTAGQQRAQGTEPYHRTITGFY